MVWTYDGHEKHETLYQNSHVALEKYRFGSKKIV